MNQLMSGELYWGTIQWLKNQWISCRRKCNTVYSWC